MIYFLAPIPACDKLINKKKLINYVTKEKETIYCTIWMHTNIQYTYTYTYIHIRIQTFTHLHTHTHAQLYATG